MTRPSRQELLSALAFLTALVVFVTWPQALYLTTRVADHDDPFLSMWRLGWIAHALRTDVAHLFDGNIFYPMSRTLAFSDATLLEGLLAAPWLWARANPVLVYNVLLLAGMVSSGAGMFMLVKHLTTSSDAALVAAAIFTVAPYRIEHFMHLELQWTAWIPLTWWAIHRTFESGRIRHGVAIGGLLALQVLSCIYYGAYLSIMTAALVIALAVTRPGDTRRVAGALATAVAVLALIAVPYGWPYVQNSHVLGPRSAGEIAMFSATLASYVSAPPQNWAWGWTGAPFTGNELRVFPGAVAVVLALCSLGARPRRLVWVYAALTALAVELSLGLNGWLYPRLIVHASVLQGLRAPARFAILACCCLALLAGFGFHRLQRWLPARLGPALLVTVLVGVGLESGSAPLQLTRVAREVPPVYRFLARAERGVVVELPIVDLNVNPVYMFWSTRHWMPLVNGYSGYNPPHYEQTLEDMRTFPDDRSISRLQALNVRYVLVHRIFYTGREYTDLLLDMMREPALVNVGKFFDWAGPCEVFQLRAPGAASREVAR